MNDRPLRQFLSWEAKLICIFICDTVYLVQIWSWYNSDSVQKTSRGVLVCSFSVKMVFLLQFWFIFQKKPWCLHVNYSCKRALPHLMSVLFGLRINKFTTAHSNSLCEVKLDKTIIMTPLKCKCNFFFFLTWHLNPNLLHVDEYLNSLHTCALSSVPLQLLYSWNISPEIFSSHLSQTFSLQNAGVVCATHF